MKFLIDLYFKGVNTEGLLKDEVMLYMFLTKLHTQIDSYMEQFGEVDKVSAYEYVGKLLYK